MRDARHRARPGAARDRLGRAHLRDARPRAAARSRRPARRRCRRAAAHVELRGVTLRLRGRRRRCCATSTSTCPPGTTVALVGATGSGKTTLVQLLPRLYDVTRRRGADRRRRRARGRPRLAAALDRRRDRRPVPVLGHVHENIAYARPDASREEVERAAERAQAAGFIAELPQGLRHARRRARADAVRRPAPAARDRPRAAGRPADPDPRRRDLARSTRRPSRRSSAALREVMAGPHDVRDRPPALDDRAGRRHRRARGRARRRARRARAAARGSPSSTPRSPPRACPDQVFLTRKPLEQRVAGPVTGSGRKWRRGRRCEAPDGRRADPAAALPRPLDRSRCCRS